MSYEEIVLDKRGPVARLRLNRPDLRNSLGAGTAGEIARALVECERDPDVRVVVLTGTGNTFCSGLRLARSVEELDLLRSAAFSDHLEGVRRVIEGLMRLEKPTIASVNGYALAGGAGLATACDLVLASDRAEFGYTEVNVGLAPAMVLVLLLRQVGFRKALELAMTGRRISAPEALELGLINEVVPHEQLEERTDQVAGDLAGRSPAALRFIKHLAYALPDMGLSQALHYAQNVVNLSAQTDDAREGIAAFFEKRPPRWPR